jgi:hypothetical protein
MCIVRGKYRVFCKSLYSDNIDLLDVLYTTSLTHQFPGDVKRPSYLVNNNIYNSCISLLSRVVGISFKIKYCFV